MAQPSDELARFLVHDDPTPESSGAFTVRVDQLALRLRTDLFEQRELYLLKVLQAGVAAQANEIRVTIARQEVVVEFPAPAGLLEPELFRRALLLESTDSIARNLLALGVGAALAFEGAEVQLSQGLYQLQLTTDGLKLLSQGDSGKMFRFTLRRSWRHWRSRATEHALACQRFLNPNVRLVLDGRRLTCHLPAPPERTIYGRNPLVDLRVGKLPGPRLLARLSDLMLPEPQGIEALRVLFPHSLKGPGRLVVVQWGVALEPLPWAARGSGAWGFLADNEMPTDLSGLMPRKCEHLERLVSRIDNMLPGWLRQTHQLMASEAKRHSLFAEAAINAGGLGAGAIGLFMVTTFGWGGLYVAPGFALLGGSGVTACMLVLDKLAESVGSQSTLLAHIEGRLRQILGRFEPPAAG